MLRVVPNVKHSLSQPELWYGAFLGAVVGKSFDTIPARWWWLGLIVLGVSVPSLLVKDRLTDRLYTRRDQEKQEWLGSGRGATIQWKWGVTDFLLGMLILLPSSLVALLAFALLRD